MQKHEPKPCEIGHCDMVHVDNRLTPSELEALVKDDAEASEKIRAMLRKKSIKPMEINNAEIRTKTLGHSSL